MYTKKRPVNINCGKFPGGNICFNTNASTYEEFASEIRSNPAMSVIAGTLSNMSMQYNGETIAIGHGSVPFLKYGKTENDLVALLNEPDAKTPDGLNINQRFKYWPVLTLVEGEKVQRSGAHVNIEESDTKYSLAEKITKNGLYDSFIKAKGMNPYSASKTDLEEFIIKNNVEEYAKAKAPQELNHDQLLIEYGRLKAENESLRSILNNRAWQPSAPAPATATAPATSMLSELLNQ